LGAKAIGGMTAEGRWKNGNFSRELNPKSPKICKKIKKMSKMTKKG